MLQKIDTMNTRAPHKRHRAAISKIKVAGFGNRREKILDGEIASTVCGKFLRNFMRADDVSLNHTDGTPFSIPCAVCFEHEEAAQ